MADFVENWADLSRWDLSIGKNVSLAGGRVTQVPGASNSSPVLRLKPSVYGTPTSAFKMKVSFQEDFYATMFDPGDSYPRSEVKLIYRDGGLYLWCYHTNDPDAAPVYRRLFGLSKGVEYDVWLGVAEGWLQLKVFQDASLIRYASVWVSANWEMHSMLFCPGRSADPVNGPFPYVGQVSYSDGLNRFGIQAFLGSEVISYPPIAQLQNPYLSMIEGQPFSWVSPSLAGSGSLVVSVQTAIPKGLILSMDGSRIRLSGVPAVGQAGSFLVAIQIEDALDYEQLQLASISITVLLASAAYFPDSPETVAAADFYYEIAGGPLRKEMSQEET